MVLVPTTLTIARGTVFPDSGTSINSTDQQHGLGKKATIGIVVGVTFAVMIILTLSFFVLQLRREKLQNKPYIEFDTTGPAREIRSGRISDVSDNSDLATYPAAENSSDRLSEFRTSTPNQPSIERPAKSSPQTQACESERKTLSAERLLGIEKRSFLDDLPRLEAGQSPRSRARVVPVLELGINPYDVEYGPNPGIFPHVAKAMEHPSSSSRRPVPVERHVACSTGSSPPDTSTSHESSSNDNIDSHESREATVSGSCTSSAIAKNMPSFLGRGDFLATSREIAVPSSLNSKTRSSRTIPTSLSSLSVDYTHWCGDSTAYSDTVQYNLEPRHHHIPLESIDEATHEVSSLMEDQDLVASEDYATGTRLIRHCSIPETSSASQDSTEIATVSTTSSKSDMSSRYSQSLSSPAISPISTVCDLAPNFPCTACDLAFSSEGQRRIHVNRKHHRRFECLKCKKTFNLRHDPKRHQVTVHRDGNKDAETDSTGLKCPNESCKTSEKTWNIARKDNFMRHVARCRKRVSKETGR